MIRRLRLAFIFILVCGSAVVVAEAQEKPLGRITYRLAMTRPASHLFEVAIEVEAPTRIPADTIDFQMPAWSPGRYGVFQFAVNVQDFTASAIVCDSNDQCQPGTPEVRRVDHQTWRVNTGSTKSLTVAYKVFSNDLSGTFSRLEERHANFNGGSIFMYIVGHKPDPVTLEIEPPKDWRIANGYSTDPNQRVWQFANYDLLMDTPTVIGPSWTMDEFKVGGKNYRVVITSLGPDGGKRPEVVRQVQKIVQAESDMWGPPECDNFTFLLTFAADDESGDGMEHLTSTNIIVPFALADEGSIEDVMGAVSHEFFHVWNGKRLRPAELGPWDFTRPVNTRGLWIYEGLTNYYTVLMLRRAGLITEQQMIDRYGSTVSHIENQPGNRRMSVEESSLTASFQDGASHSQNTNFVNNSINYYPKGETLGLVLDLLIRARTNGRASLDDVMKRLYNELYLNSERPTYYLRGRGYTAEDFIKAVSEVIRTDMHDFFRRYVSGTETAPYDEALKPFGLQLTVTPQSLPNGAGLHVDDDGSGGIRVSSVDQDSAAEAAGLSPHDTIVTVAGKSVTQAEFSMRMSEYKQGDSIPIGYKRDRRNLSTSLKVGPATRFDRKIVERPGATAEERSRRAAWLRQVVSAAP
jgi:predicted metalloprotease with PDZ domain